MFLSLFIIISSGSLSFYFTDLDSEVAFYAMVLPIMNLFILIALGLWVVTMFDKFGVDQNTDMRGGGGLGGF